MSGAPKKTPAGIWGVMAQFSTPEDVVAAAEKAFAAGYRKMDAYSPHPIEGLAEAMGKARTRIPLLVLMAGITGLFAGYGLEFFVSVIDYPLNIGGRPLNSIPSFVPVAYECTILFASLMSALGMLAINGFPMPYHPVFNVPEFARGASCDKFFLCLEATDPKFTPEGARSFLNTLKSEGVHDVEP